MTSSKIYDAPAFGHSSDELFVRRLDTLSVQHAVLTKNTYFEGGDVLVCHSGRFRFSFKDEAESIEICPGEVLFVYPGNTVTIESIARNGVLKYAILGGPRVADYFDSFGFYDRLRFSGNTQVELFDAAVRASEQDIVKSFAYINDALQTFSHNLSAGPDALRHKVLHFIHRSVSGGKTSVKTICDKLSISRSTLNRMFDAAGLCAPSDYIRAVQLRHACRLLRTTALPIADIAKRLGFSSAAYFTEFIRKNAGQTPTELRKGRFVSQ